ncbi:hypothetical protein FOPG_18851 [Fusarium oxysporum f. sp. conglutinans race 2 54008]|uniref:Uncharacterized protein n=1 Tax=Fusarium oxysporum f. sp. conglutinans race 2 54008 TaxID=1089457 RepID=X0GYD1_FUSOX|nr:hypothetical protein FOPG_18851 [Fusarium oxysporum f. sp. conglutinans race 2 54008]
MFANDLWTSTLPVALSSPLFFSSSEAFKGTAILSCLVMASCVLLPIPAPKRASRSSNAATELCISPFNALFSSCSFRVVSSICLALWFIFSIELSSSLQCSVRRVEYVFIIG